MQENHPKTLKPDTFEWECGRINSHTTMPKTTIHSKREPSKSTPVSLSEMARKNHHKIRKLKQKLYRFILQNNNVTFRNITEHKRLLSAQQRKKKLC